MNDLSHPAIQCRVHLRAGLPALGDLVGLVPEAQKLVDRTEGQLRVRRWRGPWVALGLEKGRIRQLREEEVQRPLDMVFLTDRQVNRFFRGRGWALPLITGGFGHLGLLKPLRLLADLLKKHLRVPDQNEDDLAPWRIHVQLLLPVILRAVKEIGEHDPEAGAILSQTPGGLVEFRIGALPYRTRIWWRKDRRIVETGEECASAPPDVMITFRDERIAAAAMRPGFDAAVAVGRGDLVVRGLLPLAEGLGLVMDRVPLYLESP